MKPQGPEDSVKVEINGQTTFFINTLEQLINSPRGGVSDKHVQEFNRIHEEYSKHIRSIKDPETFPPFIIEMSRHFYDTWVWRTFRDLFRAHRGLSKSTAKALNELYRDLNNDENNEDFLVNYNQYNDI